MSKDKYNQPSQGAKDWDVPLNENFQDLGIEVTAEVATFDDLPSPDSNEESTNGERRKILVQDSNIIYRDNGNSWVAIAGLGSSSSRVPGTIYHEKHDTNQQVINGRRLFIQDSEPSNAQNQDIWIDTS